MEWNTKPPLLWDWENMIMFNAAGKYKKSPSRDWETDEERGIDSGSFFSSGGSGCDPSSSDLGLATLAKCSKSASLNSQSSGEVKTSKFTIEASDAVKDDVNNQKEVIKARVVDSSPVLEAPFDSGEPLLGLKLGKRTYFEDVCAGNTARTSSFSGIPVSSVTLAKRSRSSQTTHASRCQVEGCNLDLSLAKDYHRKHRVCESHSKCPKVIIAGVERRFCQQCSRFHGLSEFDEKKKSCRRRLSDHNARRRKPQPGPVHLNSAGLSSSSYVNGAREKPQKALLWNITPMIHANADTNMAWECASASKFRITRELSLKPAKVEERNLGLDIPPNQLIRSIPAGHYDSSILLPYKAKGTIPEVLDQGLEEFISCDAVETQDFHCALSLLSTNSWISSQPKSVSFELPMHSNHSMPQSVLPVVMSDGMPVASSQYSRTELQSTDSRFHTLNLQGDGNNYFEEFHTLRSPYENNIYSSQLN